MNWNELAECQRAAAEHLFASGNRVFDRPVCGRAYYAVYSLLTSHLRNVVFGHGWSNPQHANLPKYIDHIAGLHEGNRRMIRRALRRLRQRREDADYRPGVTVDRNAAQQSLRDAAEVFRILDRSD